jgi:hypothetical protein
MNALLYLKRVGKAEFRHYKHKFSGLPEGGKIGDAGHFPGQGGRDGRAQNTRKKAAFGIGSGDEKLACGSVGHHRDFGRIGVKADLVEAYGGGLGLTPTGRREQAKQEQKVAQVIHGV